MNKDKEEKYPYGTIEEAQRRYDKMVDEIATRLCPLQNDNCRQSCVCCEELKIVNAGSLDNPIYQCQGGYCTAYALVGPLD